MKFNKLNNNFQSIPKDQLESVKFLTELAQAGISVQARRIYLPEIDIELPLALQEYISIIMQLSEPEKRLDPIELLVSTYGGESYGMLGAIDIIRTAPVKINTTVVGAAQSAGAWIAAAGTGKRAIHKSAYFMFHQLRGGQQGTMSEMADTTTHYKELQKETERLLAQFSNKNEKFWRTVTKKEFYVNATKAKEYGLVDEIIGW